MSSAIRILLASPMLAAGCSCHDLKVGLIEQPREMFEVCPYVFMNVMPGGLLLAVWKDGTILRSVSQANFRETARAYEIGYLTAEQAASIRVLLGEMPESVFAGGVIYDATYDELVIIEEDGTKVAYSVRNYHEKSPVREFKAALLQWKLHQSRVLSRDWASLFPLDHCR